MQTKKSKIDHTGKRIGSVTVLQKAKQKVSVITTGIEFLQRIAWVCKCDCGYQWEVLHSQITNNSPASCRKCADKKPRNNNDKPQFLTRSKNIKKQHPSYNSWYSMWRRCTSNKHINYMNYGGRGITVCDRWLDFDLFVEDMGVRPQGHTIDRIDNEDNYHPNNCRWATAKEQRNNQRKK